MYSVVLWEETGTRTTGSQNYKVENPTLKRSGSVRFRFIKSITTFFVVIERMSEMV